MKRVIVESPYAGSIDRNVAYARAALRDSLSRGEAPFASHLLYTQPGVLRDTVQAERAQGIDAGTEWRMVAARTVFYVDLGWSPGMVKAREDCERVGLDWETRSMDGWEKTSDGA